MTDTTIRQSDYNLSLLATTNDEERTIIKPTKNDVHMQNNNNNNNINTCGLSLLNSPVNKSLLLVSNPSLALSHQYPSASHYLSLLSSPSDDRIIARQHDSNIKQKNNRMICETIIEDQGGTRESVHHHHYHPEEQHQKNHQFKHYDNNVQDCGNTNGMSNSKNDNNNTISSMSDQLNDANDDDTNDVDDDMVHCAMKWKWELQNELDRIQFLRIQNANLLNRLAMLGVYNNEVDEHDE